MKNLLEFEPKPWISRVPFFLLATFIIGFASFLAFVVIRHLFEAFQDGSLGWDQVWLAVFFLPFCALMIALGISYRVWIFPYRFYGRSRE